MENDRSSSSWWQTMPGLLTALAGILTAGAGLLAALHQTGIIGGGQPSPQLNQPSKEQADNGREKSSSISSVNTTEPSANLSAEAPKALTDPPKYAVTFPAGNEASVHSYGNLVVIKILGAKVDSHYVGKLVITFNTQMFNKGSSGANFWDDLFRLIVDGVPRAPVSGLNEGVEPRSAKEGDVVFEIPPSAKTLILSIEGKDKAEIPITLEKLG